jgi:hypothetical protein
LLNNASWNITVFVSVGETTRVFISLVPSPTPTAIPTQASLPDMGTVSISSEPSGADFSIDSVFQGTTPLTLVSIEQGPHTIVITKEGYEWWQTEIMVQNAGNHSIEVRLVPVVTTTTPMSVGGGFGGGGAVEEAGGVRNPNTSVIFLFSIL